ncbi:hypothetical protein EUX98_g8859 [Antrodiella citrinella]|uniref:Uncharacterized protein n=1 Tax=Antrodiella citrinella TaxID=2447956 RepID=A0A4S4M1P4_9APHY|nr:hypothetical protein EUX98_g8859 [Antrodiella citrinella]
MADSKNVMRKAEKEWVQALFDSPEYKMWREKIKSKQATHAHVAKLMSVEYEKRFSAPFQEESDEDWKKRTQKHKPKWPAESPEECVARIANRAKYMTRWVDNAVARASKGSEKVRTNDLHSLLAIPLEESADRKRSGFQLFCKEEGRGDSATPGGTPGGRFDLSKWQADKKLLWDALPEESREDYKARAASMGDTVLLQDIAVEHQDEARVRKMDQLELAIAQTVTHWTNETGMGILVLCGGIRTAGELAGFSISSETGSSDTEGGKDPFLKHWAAKNVDLGVEYAHFMMNRRQQEMKDASSSSDARTMVSAVAGPSNSRPVASTSSGGLSNVPERTDTSNCGSSAAGNPASVGGEFSTGGAMTAYPARQALPNLNSIAENPEPREADNIAGPDEQDDGPPQLDVNVFESANPSAEGEPARSSSELRPSMSSENPQQGPSKQKPRTKAKKILPPPESESDRRSGRKRTTSEKMKAYLSDIETCSKRKAASKLPDQPKRARK